MPGPSDLASLLRDEQLAGVFDGDVLDRGRDYARQGRVESCSVAAKEGTWLVQGSVGGSGARSYTVLVTLQREGETHLGTFCTCPYVGGCKHAVALLVEARHRQATGDVAPVVPAPLPRTGRPDLRVVAPTARRWADDLDDLIADLGEQPTLTAHPTPMALMVDLPRRAESAARRGPWFRDRRDGPGTLRVRPVMRGASGRWVRSGIAWSDFADVTTRLRLPPEHVRLTRELLIAQRATSSHLYGAAGADLELGQFGPGLWRLLERARELRLPLVPGGRLARIHVSSEPGRVAVDLAASDGVVAVRAGVHLHGELVEPGGATLLGDPAHGLARWHGADDRWTVELAPLVETPHRVVARMLRDGDEIAVPVEELDQLWGEHLPRLQRLVTVGSHDRSVEVPAPSTPRLRLTVGWSGPEVDPVAVSLRWTWQYLRAGLDVTYELDDDPRVGPAAGRDVELEARTLAALRLTDDQAAVLQSVDGDLVAQQTLRGAPVLTFAADVLPGLRASEDVELVELGTEPAFAEAQGSPEVTFSSVARGDESDGRTDWLDLEVVVSIDGHQVGLATVLEALTLQQDRVVLPGGTWMSLDHPELDRLARLVGEARDLRDGPRDPSAIRVSRHQTGLWEELAELGLVDEQAERWVRAARALRDVAAMPEVPHPPGLTATLRPYQRDGLAWLAQLWEHGLGGILADDMGLGKTVQMLALVAHARARGGDDAPFLVVAPTSVVGTWAGEAAQFTPDLVVTTVTASRGRRRRSLAEVAAGADVVVTSYTLLRLEVEEYAALPWAGLVLDEAQAVKNHQAKTHQAVRRLARPFTVAITGTPMENGLMELWSLLSITAPGLYPQPGRFADQVVKPIERGGDRAALEALRRRTRPLMLRRTKDLVAADLPPKQEQVLPVALTPRHRAIYDTHLQRERQQILGLLADDPDAHRLAIFRSLTRLRRLSLAAGLVDEAHAGVASAKIDLLVEHLRELAAEGHRALVFSQFTGFLALARQRLEREGLASSYLDGTTRDRPSVIAGFKDGDAPVFLISLKAGGVGLTLTEADYVFLLDPWWNPAVEAQAVDRTHRIGQQRQVMVYRLVATDTIEEKVMELKVRKAELFASVVDGDAFADARITADDIAGLLG